jgi:hypothetical protein
MAVHPNRGKRREWHIADHFTLNNSRKADWIKATAVFVADPHRFTQMALFSLQRAVPAHVTPATDRQSARNATKICASIRLSFR